MQTFVGIDVGATKLFGASIHYDDGGNSQIAFPSSVVPAEVCVWTSGLIPEAIGIDSPSGTSLDKAGRRDVERQLGIGGCYATPSSEEGMPPWMRQGLATYRSVATALGASDSLHDGSGRLFETHPTYAFKSLLGVRDAEGRITCDPDRRLLPKRPRRKGGHAQRVQLLVRLASHFGISIEPHFDRLKSNIDDVDALLAAFMGLLRWKGLTRSVGNPSEGTISIACLDHDDPLRVACQGSIAGAAQSATEAGRAQSQPGVMGSEQAADGSEGYALALGPSGPGGMSPQQTLASLFGPWSIDGRGYFPTTFHPGLWGAKSGSSMMPAPCPCCC